MLDTKDDPAAPRIVQVLGPEELGKHAGYSRPHTVHCGPGALFISCLGADGEEGPGGIALLDHNSFEVLGAWEADRGGQYLAYDFWWHINDDVLITSEWATPSMIEDGIVPEPLLGRKYGHRLHFWDMKTRSNVQTIDPGDEHQMVLELRPAHDPTKKCGFAGVVVSVEDLSASIWLWHGDGDHWAATKVISIPAEPAPAESLPPLLQGFGAVPPLVTDINLPVDDRFLYVSCWGTGELKQYDVSDPFDPRQAGRYGSAASPAGRRTPPGRASPSAAGRRWSRSAATARVSTSPTPCTAPGTTSSTPTVSAPGWSSSMPATAAGSPSTSGSSCMARRSAAAGRTRSGSRAATSSDSYCYPP